MPPYVPLLPPAPRVCIVLLTGLGDVVLGLPLATAIRRAHPRAHITWVAEPMPAQVLEPHAAIDRVVVFEKRRGWRGVLDLRRKLAGERFDVTLNLNIYFKSVWPVLLAGGRVRLGFERGRARDGTWLVANRHLPAGPRRHTLDMFLEFAAALGIDAHPLEFGLALTAAEQAARDAFRAEVGGEYAALVPASGNRHKDWPVERTAAVADALQREHGLRSVLVGGPGARETAVAKEIVARAQTPPVWALGDGVRRLVWLIDGARLVISPDSGPVHIARALERPVIGLYGHTNPWRVGPYRRYQELWIDAYTDGQPDPSNFEPKAGRMERITVADVLEKVSCAL